MPDDIRAKLREIGARIDPAATAAIYAPLHASSSGDGVTIVRDCAYGPHHRQVLDAFVAATANECPEANGRPVVVFIHGGGFVRGAKTLDGLPFYDNVMRWAAVHGMVGININYRLAPESTWPSGIDDLMLVMTWLDRHIARFGGDRSRVFLWGHSAGAAHAADYIATLPADGGRQPGIRGAILTSGFYWLGDEVSEWRAYYGDDVATYAARSSLTGLAHAGVPLLVTDAELDPESFRSQARLLVEARRAAGTPVDYVHLAGHSHISETYAIGTSDRSLTDRVLSFVSRQ